MNIFVTIGCLAVLAVTAYADDAYIEQYLAKSKECAIKQGMSDADIAKFMNMEAGDVQTFGCAEACVYKAYNMMAAGGGFDTNVANELIDKMIDDNPDFNALLKAVVAECSKLVTGMTDECALAKKFADCYHEKTKHATK